MAQVGSQQAFLGAAAIVLCFAVACSDGSSPKAVASPNADAGVRDARADAPVSIDPARSCANATDCEIPSYLPAVADAAPCSCPQCPVTDGSVAPVNKETHAAYRQRWEERCLTWATALPCPPTPCPATTNLVCEEGQCTVR